MPDLLNRFDALTEAEEHQAAAGVLRRIVEGNLATSQKKRWWRWLGNYSWDAIKRDSLGLEDSVATAAELGVRRFDILL
jgi:hypothetical protein